MRTFNSIEVIKGRLAADPDMRVTARKGAAAAELVVLSSRRVLNEETGEWEDAPTTRHICKAYGRLAENIAASLSKGTAVLIVGERQTETWADKDTGDKRYKDIVMIRAIGADLERATVQITRNLTSSSE